MVGLAGFLVLVLAADADDPSSVVQASHHASLVRMVLKDQESLSQDALAQQAKPLATERNARPQDHTPEGSEEGIPGLPPADGKPAQSPAGTATSSEPGETLCTDEAEREPARLSFLTEHEETGSPTGSVRGRWMREILLDGWLDQGVTINTLSPRNRSNGPVTFNNRSNEYQLNQAYLYAHRDIDLNCDAWQWGGRVDMLYGTDSMFTSARGLEVYDDLSPKWNAQQYGLSMPQMYAEVFAPWGSGVDVKLGHFYSAFGYESVMAPDNFFYSHSYTFQYGEPFTFTGFIGSTKLGDFTLRAGMSRGWDNWEDNNNDLGFVGGIDWKSRSERTSIALNVTAGREQPDVSSNVQSVYSLVIQQQFGERLQYVIQHDYGDEPGGGVDGSNARWYGLNQYFLFTLNERWKAGARLEWFRDEGGARVPGFHQTADYFEMTAGVNWTPRTNILVRPELRYDWTGTDGCYPFGDGTRSSQVLLDCDVIVRF